MVLAFPFIITHYVQAMPAFHNNATLLQNRQIGIQYTLVAIEQCWLIWNDVHWETPNFILKGLADPKMKFRRLNVLV